MIKAELEIVLLNDVVTASTSQTTICVCDTIGAVGQDHTEDDC